MDSASVIDHFLWNLLREPAEKDESLVCTWCGGHAMFSTREDRISLCHDCGGEYLERNRPPAILENQVAVVVYSDTRSGCPHVDGPVFLPTFTDPGDPEKFSKETDIEYDKFFILNPDQHIGLLEVESGYLCETCFERGAYSIGYVGTEEEVAAWVEKKSGYLPNDERAYGRSFSYQELVENIDDGPLIF